VNLRQAFDRIYKIARIDKIDPVNHLNPANPVEGFFRQAPR